jgi:hypothetical protein
VDQEIGASQPQSNYSSTEQFGSPTGTGAHTVVRSQTRILELIRTWHLFSFLTSPQGSFDPLPVLQFILGSKKADDLVYDEDPADTRHLPEESGYRCRLMGRWPEKQRQTLDWRAIHRVVASYLTALEYTDGRLTTGSLRSVNVSQVREFAYTVYSGMETHPDYSRHRYRLQRRPGTIGL